MANLNRLKAVLAEQDKTGKWLAEQLGKSTCTVSKWCKNSVQQDLQTLERIAQIAFQVTVLLLFARMQKKCNSISSYPNRLEEPYSKYNY